MTGADITAQALLRRPYLYLVTDTGLCGGFDGVVATARAAAENGADFVQVRDHEASTRDLVTLTEEVAEAVRPAGARCVVDDRLDVALAARADGVHLGQRDLHPVRAREIARHASETPFHIGLSVSNLEQAREARALPRGTVDLLGIGPLRETATKPEAAAPLGLEGVAAIAEMAWDASLPSVVIGGVKLPDVDEMLAVCVRGIAVVSAICGQSDPVEATRALRSALDRTPCMDTGAVVEERS